MYKKSEFANKFILLIFTNLLSILNEIKLISRILNYSKFGIFKMQAKVVLIGLATVGKSTIRERYLGIDFRPAYLQTVGADFTMKEQIVEGTQSVILQIWDLAGQQGFSNIRESFYKGTDGAILVFDVNNQNSAESIKDWIKELSLQKKNNIPLLLVGNKIDLRDSHSISHDQGLKLAKSLSLKFKNDIQFI